MTIECSALKETSVQPSPLQGGVGAERIQEPEDEGCHETLSSGYDIAVVSMSP